MKLYRTGKKLALQAAIAACFALPISALAADLTVAQGDSQTISADVTYDAVVVNGNLAIANGITLTCTSLTVADNINGTATLTVGDGATVTVTGSNATKIGVGAGRAEVYLGTGATLRANSNALYFCYGYGSVPESGSRMTEALLVVGTNAKVYVHTDFFFGYGSNSGSYIPSGMSKSTVKAEVRLDSGAEITAQRVRMRTPVSEKILFNGGKITQRSSSYNNAFFLMDYESKDTNLHLEGTNSCPVHLHLNSLGSFKALTSFGSTGCKIIMSGDGGLLKTGAGVFPLADMTGSWDSSNPNMRFLFTGDFTVRDGGFSVANSLVAKPFFVAAKNNVARPIDLVVEDGASFDFAGWDVVMNSIRADGTGIVTNSAEGAMSATIGVRNDGRDSVVACAMPGVSIVKKGTSTLTLCDSGMDSVDMQGGTLVLKDRPRLGYKFYKIKFDEYGLENGSNERLYLSEFALFGNGQDVTRPYSALHHDKIGSSYVSDPERLVDGDLSTDYYDLRIQKPYGDSDRDRVQLTIEYASYHPVDGYRWAPRSTSKGYLQNPTDWKLYGGMSMSGLVLLDEVTGFEVSDVVDGWNATNFVCRYESSPMTIGSLTLGAGMSLPVDGAAVIVNSLVTASALPVTLAHGAALTLPEETEISSLTIDLGNGGGTLTNFRPSENGALYITRSPGVMARGVPLPVRVDNLVADRLYSWKVYIDGEIVENAQLSLNSDGYLVVRTGFILFVL